MIKTVVYKPLSESKPDIITPDIGLRTKTDAVYYNFGCSDNQTVLLTIENDMVMTAYSVSAGSSDGAGVGGTLYLNNMVLLGIYQANASVYIYSVPYWLIRKNSVFKLTIPHDPAQARNLNINIIGYRA